MRITGGEMCGRQVRAPRGIRPTQDKVREALFSCLCDRVVGCRFLDLFAGSGAIGLEAWSRGADSVCWVEADGRVLAVLRKNVESAVSGQRSVAENPGGRFTPVLRDGPRTADSGQHSSIVRSDAVRFLKSTRVTGPFDIIFADPPYDSNGARGWSRNILRALETNPMFAANGVLVIEQGATEPAPQSDDLGEWAMTRVKVYGDTQLRFFEK